MIATRPRSMRVFTVAGMRSGWPLGLVLLTACTFSATQTGPFAGPGNRDCSECPEMVIVPAGEFQMGSPDREEGRNAHESPMHTVHFARPFAIGMYEVTFDEWDACVAVQACAAVPDDGWGRGRRPVINVNFQMATDYARWLSEKTGKPYRLPSEAEWEYAARAGSTTPWYWGDDSKQACEYANVGDQSVKAEHPDWPLHDCNDGFPKTSPVGSFKPNRFGLHDTAGNVWEWVEDCYNPSYEGAPADGRAWLAGDCVRRIDRGGGWYNKPSAVRPALRYAGDDPARQNNTLGFRVARSLDTPAADNASGQRPSHLESPDPSGWSVVARHRKNHGASACDARCAHGAHQTTE